MTDDAVVCMGWSLSAQEQIDGFRKEVRELKAENNRLRELVRDMHAVISDRNSWWDCMCKDTRHFADCMRELGVEVNE